MRLLGTLLLAAVAVAHAQDADTLFDRGMTLAREGRWEAARETLEQGRALAPRDPRFPTELAGVAYRLEENGRAKRSLRRAMKLSGADEPYIRDFLGTLYLLEGNVEATLASWSAIGKPVLSAIDTPAGLASDPVLLDRAFTAAPTELLTLPQLRETRARLDLLELFGTYDFDIAPEPDDDRYRLRLRGLEAGFGVGSPLITAARWLRGIPFQTVQPEWRNIGGEGRTVSALARWNPRRRRASIEYAAPLGSEASERWRLFADGRDERWAFREDGPELRVRKAEAGVGFRSVVNGAFSWGGEAAMGVRSYGPTAQGDPRTPDALGVRADVLLSVALLRVPSRRVTVTADARLGVGRVFDPSSGLYGRSEGSVTARWTSADGAWGVRGVLQGGGLTGNAPLDELYLFGLDRDPTVGFRGMRAARDGRKGASPLGDRFWLSSLDLTRKLPSPSLVDLRLGPFLEAGGVADSRNVYGRPGAQLAAGLRLEMRVLGAVGVSLTYGRNLRNGGDLWFARPLPEPR